MTLPRFTAGAMGRLTFRDLNEAFEAIDQLRKQTDQKLEEQLGRRRIVLARITGKQGDDYSWEEIERTSATTYAVRPNGRTSVEGGNAYANPIVGLGSVSFAVGDNIAIVASYTASGTLFYVPLAVASSGGGGADDFWSIANSVSLGNNRWRYDLSFAEWISASNDFLVAVSPTRSGYNTAEWAVDSASYGVGFIPAAIPSQVIRQPIKNGTIVKASRINPRDPFNFDLGFTVPNGYRIVC